MQGDNVVFLIQVGTATDSSVNLRNGLQALCHNSVLQLVATQFKADRPMRSAQPGGDHQGLSYVWRHGTVAKATPAACGFLAQLIFMLSAVV